MTGSSRTAKTIEKAGREQFMARAPGTKNQRALILGSGGPAANAWEIGLAAGLEDRGISIRNADLYVGTSAGARVAVEFAGSLPIEELFQKQINPSLYMQEALPAVDWKDWRAEIMKLKEPGGDPGEILRRIGRLALASSAASREARRKSLASQLSTEEWPEKSVLITAVNAEAGVRRVFDRNSGIGLLDAVEASGAIAGIWPPVLFEAHHYMDGGFYSTDNADLGEGFERVLIVALRAGVPPLGVVSLESAVEKLRRGGAMVEVIHPDQATESAFAAAGGLLNPAGREPAAKAARAQGQRIATESLKAFWN